MQVIVVLAGVVEEPGVLPKEPLTMSLKRFAFPLGVPKEMSIVDVGEVMLVP